jgi:hypothetical protein
LEAKQFDQYPWRDSSLYVLCPISICVINSDTYYLLY